MNDNRGCLGFLYPQPLPQVRDRLPYMANKSLLTAAELSFYHVLRLALSEKATICSKVRLADVFFLPQIAGRMRYFRPIAMKHVDFLICDRNTMKPLFGLELDDSSHQRPDRIARDQFVNAVFEAAQLPLIHVPVRAAYNAQEIRSLLTPYIERFIP